MSVICQNFVQNAWKKDLCSNCFKSVGDHGRIETAADPDSGEKPKARYVSQSPSAHASRSNGTNPHTTWKSLISEKNDRNSKPFNLETGFRGRLLTINKACNGTEKKNGVESPQNARRFFANGHLEKDGQKSFNSCNGQPMDDHDDEQHSLQTEKGTFVDRAELSKETEDVSISKVNNKCAVDVRNKSSETAKPAVNGFASKSVISWKTRSSEVSAEDYTDSSASSATVDAQGEHKTVPRLNGVRKLDKLLCNGHKVTTNDENGSSRKEQRLNSVEKIDHSMVPQSILKKTVLSPHPDQPRRGSSVGFANEEPLVIGYGGRDFSPEELEWDMASSDGETENAFDSLDETEDDKAFSKMTKKNTEFNSYNSNLLHNGVSETSEQKTQRGGLELRVETEAAKNGVRREGAGDSPKKEDEDGRETTSAAGAELREEQPSQEGVSAELEVENSLPEGDGEPAGMFADSPEWADDFSLPADEILQAINISLTARHEMRDRLPGNGENTHDEATNETVPDGEDVIDPADIVVEPRASFLHGVVSSARAPKPSAIYGPASDLFVTRSNSSSSSSSEETSTSVTVTVAAGEEEETVDNTDEGKAELKEELKKEKEPSVIIKTKPQVPAKPTKHPKPDGLIITDSTDTADGTYYSIPDSPRSVSLVDHYAESSIYHEVKVQEGEPFPKATKEERDSKLAALAVELEQARQLQSNTKRQAPAPPRIPDPPLEDPPSCAGFSSFRGEAMGFSSASSTTSTSSQETEAAYASWTLGDESRPRYSKSKSSFLLAQYSKCKMLAMGDGARGRKKFSLKKLLKIGKDQQVAFDPNCTTHPKAWKYSDRFERPRAKLEIIHPMDLENKSVTINPGFESSQSGSMTSFGGTPEDNKSSRNSVFSDYGSYYSDTLTQDTKTEATYEYIQPHVTSAEERGGTDDTGSSISPTPSRSSQASTLTTGSSKNGSSPPHRPPKPPPPPRAHSLLPGNKAPRNLDGTFKFPVAGCNSWSGEEAVSLPPKPQAPRRQCKAVAPRSDYANFEECKSLSESDGPIEKEDEDQEVEEIVCEATTAKQEESFRTQDDKEQVPIEEEETTPVDDKSFKPAPSKPPPATKAPARPPPIYSKPQPGAPAKRTDPWISLEDSYLALSSTNRELLIRLLNQALRRRKNLSSELQKIHFRWSDFEVDAGLSIFVCGERVTCHATMPRHPENPVTLVITLQQQETSIQESEAKYPVFCRFTDQVPDDLLPDSPSDSSPTPSTVLVLSRCEVTTVENFAESLPSTLTQECEKEVCFIVLQLIHALKSFQAQGIESIEAGFQNLLLAKSLRDQYHTLVFVSDNPYYESDESQNISLCQYALLLLSQMVNQDSDEYSSETSRNVFRTAINLLSEEKAGSLSQTKILLECFLWDVTRVLANSNVSDDVLHRWFDIERSNSIKNMIADECTILNIQTEYHSQFLIRTNVRNVREVSSMLFDGRTKP